jgi:cytochrome d ubiquinol oxidase subunit II
MSVAAVILVPIVLIYQGWCWYIFRHRVKPDDVKH